MAQVLTTFVKEKLNLPNRSIELNLPQRCASHIASKTDIDEAFNCGVKAVEFMLQGESGMMVSMNRNNSLEYIALSPPFFHADWLLQFLQQPKIRPVLSMR